MGWLSTDGAWLLTGGGWLSTDVGWPLTDGGRPLTDIGGLLTDGGRLFADGYWLLTDGCWLLTYGGWLPTDGYWLSTESSWLPTDGVFGGAGTASVPIRPLSTVLPGDTGRRQAGQAVAREHGHGACAKRNIRSSVRQCPLQHRRDHLQVPARLPHLPAHVGHEAQALRSTGYGQPCTWFTYFCGVAVPLVRSLCPCRPELGCGPVQSTSGNTGAVENWLAPTGGHGRPNPPPPFEREPLHHMQVGRMSGGIL